MTSLEDLPLRPDLVGQRPYGAPQLNVPVSLNVNENTHPLSPALVEAISARLVDALAGINRYPDREATGLRSALGAYLGGVGPERIWAANGSNEILQQIFLAFGGPGRRAISFAPSYSMYPILAALTGTDHASAPRAERFELGAKELVSGIREHWPDITLLCSPNNPTGTPLALAAIEAAYEATEGILVVDEAYHEFAEPGTPSAITLLPGRPRLLVSRTMSKAFAFAGARLGYLIADPAVIDALRLVRLPYHLSALTQAAATAALEHAPELLVAVSDIRAQRKRIERELGAMGLDVFRSEANFVLFGGVASSQEAFAALLERGILVRDVGIPGTLRVTAGTEGETTAFLGAMAELTAKH